MLNFTVAQHFFSSVPAEQSPQRRRGYQTLFATRGLTDTIIRAIEDRAQYASTQGEPVKYQFYPLSPSLFAAARILPLQERDEFGRRGRYLAHTLILSLQNLQDLGGCPLDLLQQAPFVNTLDEVFQKCQTKDRDAPPLRVSLQPAWLTLAASAARRWPATALEQLGRLTWQVETLLKERNSVALIGPESEQWETLALLFALAAPAMRPRLSFDTYAAGCAWAPEVNFWLQGYPDTAGIRSTHQVEVGTGRISSSLSPSADGVFARWMSHTLRQGQLDLPYLQQEQEWICALEGVLAGEPLQLHAAIPPQEVQRFAALNREAIVRRWLAQLPEGLSQDLLQPISADINREPEAYLQTLIEGGEADVIQDVVFGIVGALRREPSKGDQKILRRWVDATPHTGLAAMFALWDQNSKAWVQALNALSKENYRWLIKELLQWPKQPLPLWEALVHPHELAWVQWAGPALPPEEWKKALPVLAQLGDPAMQGLVSILPRLPEASREVIAAWVKKNKDSAAPLAAALGLQDEEKKRRFKLFG